MDLRPLLEPIFQVKTEEDFSLCEQLRQLCLTTYGRTAFRAAVKAHDDRCVRTFYQLLLTGYRVDELVTVHHPRGRDKSNPRTRL